MHTVRAAAYDVGSHTAQRLRGQMEADKPCHLEMLHQPAEGCAFLQLTHRTYNVQALHGVQVGGHDARSLRNKLGLGCGGP